MAGTFRWSEDPNTAWHQPSTAEDPAYGKEVSSNRLRELKRKIQAVLYVCIGM
jgi:hypothetical protein